MWIDHVILGVQDLAIAAAALRERDGLDSYQGGVHPEWGTGNRIVPFGSTYLELLGIVDPALAARSTFGRAFASLVAQGDRLSGWCVGTDDLDGVATRLGLHVVPGGRIRPDGTLLRWRTVGLDDAILDRSLPFFIAWDVPMELHPGRTPVEHRVTPSGITWVEVSGDEGRVGEWLGGEDLPVRMAVGEPAIRAVGIGSDAGEIVLP